MLNCLASSHIPGDNMFDKEQEERRLVEANQHIAKAQELVQLLRKRLELLRAEGTPGKAVEDILAGVLESLALMQYYRDLILARLAE
jgi:hypothetical protein